MKIDIEDFLFEIKDEMLCYEEMGKEKYAKWEIFFKKWLNNDKINKKKIKKDNKKTYYIINDESEIFEIVDEYYYAVIENREEEYFKNFKNYI